MQTKSFTSEIAYSRWSFIKKKVYEIKHFSIGTTHVCRLYYFQAWIKSYFGICKTGLWGDIYVLWLPLQWRRNESDGVSNHQHHHCLLNRVFRRRSKKTSKLRVTGLCVGNSPGTGEFPTQRASNAENVSIWWRHHDHQSISVLLIAACHGFQMKIIFIWQQPKTSNKFTQRVTHSLRHFSVHDFITNIVSSLILDHLFSSLVFHLELHLFKISNEKKMGKNKVFVLVIWFEVLIRRWMPMIKVILNTRIELTKSNHNTIIIASSYLNSLRPSDPYMRR